MGLVIRLRVIAPDQVIADPECEYSKNILPARARFLAPDAASSWLCGGLNEFVVTSDMRRAAESSLLAIRTKKGALPPGWSGHGFGECVDIGTKATAKNLGFPIRSGWKRQLDDWMAARGWYCHRTDHLTNKEQHHYNFLGHKGGGFLRKGEPTTGNALERKLQSLYTFKLSKKDIQWDLKKLGFYSGEIDGIIGPLSKQAVKAFQRAWGLKSDGDPGPVTQRCLSFVAAEIVTV